jgi:hypothetical protein
MSGFPRRKILLIGGLTAIFIIGSLLVLANLNRFKDPTTTSAAKLTPTPSQSPTEISSNQSAPEGIVNDLSIVPKDTATKIPTVTHSQNEPSATPNTNTSTQTHASTTSIPTTSPTSTAVSGGITGRVRIDGTPADGVALKLEDQDLNTISETVVGSDGSYTFSNLDSTATGYNLVFSLEWNPQFELGQVVSWGWVGPIPVVNGTVVQIPDFDISLLGFEPTTPAPNVSLSAKLVTSSSPLEFKWAAYPEATGYWVDLVFGQEQTIVWQSLVAESTSIRFDGILNSGAQIQPGEYRWGVGAQRDLGHYKLTVYGYLPAFTIVP